MNLCMSGDICVEMPVESTTFKGQFRFCQKHQEVLDRVREELGQRNFRTKRQNYKGADLERYCETPGCYGRPVYGGDYCHDCHGDD